MKQKCQELKVKILDQSDVQEIKEHVASKEELSKLSRAFDSFNSRHKELTKRPNIFVFQWYVKLIYAIIKNLICTYLITLLMVSTTLFNRYVSKNFS